MNKITIMLVLVTMMFFSCNQTSKSTAENIGEDTFELVKDQRKSAKTDKSVYTKDVYTNSKGAKLTIQNSFPKGGIKYTDTKGNKYIYAVFWTRIINETDDLVKLKINFPVDSYEILGLPKKYYKTLIPSDTMTIQKIPLFNYGLTNLEPFFDKNIDKPSSLKRAIKPKEATGFYVVTLRLIGDGDKFGVLRTEISLKGQKLFYKIRDKEIECGSIEIK
ncbi:hypothetical protein [Flavobacterium ginsenosidimutans]|uniref:hypothetical protein n=1 Tax=Flavobacterium ginsenosidimutans TaxID=687844 RepID=UPI003D95F55E